MDNELAHIIALSHLPGLGAGSYWKLLQAFSSVEAIYHGKLSEWPLTLADPAAQQWQQYQRNASCSKLGLKVEQNLSWCHRQGVQIVSHLDERYPCDLKQTPRYPPLLYILGEINSLSLPQIAIIGSRKPTEGGRRNAIAFSSHLAASGFTVTSGLALGIDAAAHQGALDVGGNTVAVLGTGIDKVYPYRHRKLARQIVSSGGALVSEFPIGTPAHAANFPQRNRIISGLSCGVLVVEAAIKSGSLITARYALQHNREVFALPGSIHNPQSAGCHLLIKQGAHLVENCEDIVDQLLGYLLNKQLELDTILNNQQTVLNHQIADKFEPQKTDLSALGEHEQALLSLLSHDPLCFDELIERSCCDAATLSHTILLMEMKGLIANDDGLYSAAVSGIC